MKHLKQEPQKIFADGSDVFFTSDLHFNHEGVIGYCRRPFSNVEEMNETLIKNWNDTVKDTSTIFCLGDFAWGKIDMWRPIVERLKGHIILIKGNHDFKQLKSQAQFDELFEHSLLQINIEIEKRKIILNHYPLLCYAGIYREKKDLVYNLHGHIHTMKNSIGKDFERYTTLAYPTQYDVGVDMNGYKPISWKQVDERVQYQIENNVNIKHWLT